MGALTGSQLDYEVTELPSHFLFLSNTLIIYKNITYLILNWLSTNFQEGINQ